MAEQLDLDAVNELNKTLKELTSESSELSKKLRDFRAGIELVRNPFLSSMASLTSTIIEQRNLIRLENSKIKQHNESINKQITAAGDRIKQEQLNQSILEKLELANGNNIKIVEAQRAAMLAQQQDVTKLANTVQSQIQAKQQEISQIKNAAAEEKAKKKEALDAQSALIRSKIEEIQENRKNKIKVVRPEAKLKALREQEQSLASEYTELEKSTGMSVSVQEKLNQQESELATLNAEAIKLSEEEQGRLKRLSDTRESHLVELQRLNDRSKEYNNKILESQQAQGGLADAQKKLKEQIKPFIKGLLTSPAALIALGQALQKVSAALLGMVQTIRDTQNKLGISSSNAIDLIMGNFAQSVKSFFTGTTVTGKEILSAQEAFRAEFGGVITSSGAMELAQQAKDLGVSAEQLASARRVFMTTSMGNVGEAKAQTDRFVAEFQKRGLTSKDAMEAITKNSELFARNGNRFAQSFVRAAAEAKKIGVDLGKVDQVGDNIIGDFEGFLTKTAELGAMGFGLDSGRLAEVAETGDTGALFDELRSQLAATGKDITNLRRSEQLALSQAFGIPMAELQRLAAPTAGSGEQLTEQEQTNSLLTNILDKAGYIARALGMLAGLTGGVQAFLLRRIAINTQVSAAKSGATEATGAIKSAAGVAGGAAPVAGGGAGAGVSGISKLTSGINPASLLKGAASLLIMAGALYVMGKALQQFKDVSAGDLGVAIGAITVLTLALVALGALMGSAIGGVLVLAGIGALVLMAGAVYLIGKSLQAVGDSSEGIAKLGSSFDILASALGRLNALDFSKLDKIKELANTNLALQPITAPTVPTVPPTTPKAPPATGAAPTTPPVTPATPVTPVDFAPLEKKLDAVVAAIGRMSVQLDGNKVGRVVATTAASTAQVGVLARSS